MMDTERSNLEDSGLQEHIAHWAEVLDRWVKRIDAGLREENGDPSGPDGEERG
jgi:translation initiation factor 2 alpha subunit (eIF-2alpha)